SRTPQISRTDGSSGKNGHQSRETLPSALRHHRGGRGSGPCNLRSGGTLDREGFRFQIFQLTVCGLGAVRQGEKDDLPRESCIFRLNEGMKKTGGQPSCFFSLRRRNPSSRTALPPSDRL